MKKGQCSGRFFGKHFYKSKVGNSFWSKLHLLLIDYV